MSSLTLESDTERQSIRPRRRFSRNVDANIVLYVGAALLLAIVVLALCAPWLGTSDPLAMNPQARLALPSAEHWFGTDRYGRDVYSRVLYGGRISLLVAFTVALLSGVVGIALGVLASFVRLLDGVVMRFMDGLMSIPSVLFAIALMALAGPSIRNVIFVITITEIPRLARLVRSFVLSLREQAFVEAAITSGTRLHMLLLRHILPNIMSPVLVQLSFVAGSAMITESMLSFLGVGPPPEIPSWGNIVSEGRAFFQVTPSIILFPSVFLTMSVLGINLLGTGLNRIVDPKSRPR
jgi:peptide/nickel transport system permease protein